MANILRENKKTYWIDAEGNKVQTKHIAKHSKKRDKLVESVFSELGDQAARLKKTKENISKLVDKFLDEFASEYSEKWQGNTVLINFDETLQVEVAIAKKIDFDEHLQIAKQKIDSYITSLATNANKDLMALINRAFKLDKKKNLDVKQILGLKQVEINAPEWLEAMGLIDKAIKIVSSKVYYRFKKKVDGNWENVDLNFSSI